MRQSWTAGVLALVIYLGMLLQPVLCYVDRDIFCKIHDGHLTLIRLNISMNTLRFGLLKMSKSDIIPEKAVMSLGTQ